MSPYYPNVGRFLVNCSNHPMWCAILELNFVYFHKLRQKCPYFPWPFCLAKEFSHIPFPKCLLLVFCLPFVTLLFVPTFVFQLGLISNFNKRVHGQSENGPIFTKSFDNGKIIFFMVESYSLDVIFIHLILCHRLTSLPPSSLMAVEILVRWKKVLFF